MDHTRAYFAVSTRQPLTLPLPLPQQGTSSLNNTGSSTASTGNQGWLSNVLAFIRWKKLPRRKNSKGQSREEKGGGGGHDDGGATPGVSPTPGKGFARKTRTLLPKQLPDFAGRKQVRSVWCAVVYILLYI